MEIHATITKDLFTGQKSRYPGTACMQKVVPQEGRVQREPIHKVGRSSTKPGSGSQDSAHLIGVWGGLAAPPGRQTYQCELADLCGGCARKAHFPNLLPAETRASDGFSTSKAAWRVTVFNEEVPRMSSGRPVGGGQAARRIPENAECHNCQASEPMM